MHMVVTHFRIRIHSFIQVCMCHARHALPRLPILDMSRRHMTRVDKAWFSYPADLPATIVVAGCNVRGPVPAGPRRICDVSPTYSNLLKIELQIELRNFQPFYL